VEAVEAVEAMEEPAVLKKREVKALDKE